MIAGIALGLSVAGAYGAIPFASAGSTSVSGAASLAILDWNERVGVPALGNRSIPAKIDTGAKTSSLHAFDIRPFQRDGAQWVRFRTDLSGDESVEVEAPVVDTRKIKSSNGQSERRYVIALDIDLGGASMESEFTLADRSRMKYPILIGRRTLSGRFLVNS